MLIEDTYLIECGRLRNLLNTIRFITIWDALEYAPEKDPKW